MYIQKAQIKNIRSIIDFEIEFPNPAGWHVLIGDNGAGKSTIIRSMALALVGEEESSSLRQDFGRWINKNKKKGEIKLFISTKEKIDKIDTSRLGLSKKQFLAKFANKVEILLSLEGSRILEADKFYTKDKSKPILGILDLEADFAGFFSVAYGPFRRFKGGSSEWEDVFTSPHLADLAAHLSIFGESVALTETVVWLKDLKYKSLENDKVSENTLENLTKLLNSEDEDGSFLQHNAKLHSISSKGVFFKDGNGTIISVSQMSDGYRSILSMTFELIRQLVRVYGSDKVFKNIEKGDMFINLPGVVLVDEIDVHLHPTWQTRIGQWFLKYFPKLQFIVTTHSPLVCRAAEKGSIWRLAAPGSDEESGEVIGVDRERLIYGNILDAYGTEVFGDDVSISQDSIEKQEEMVKLGKKKMLDAISLEEEEELEDLKKVFTTDAPIEL